MLDVLKTANEALLRCNKCGFCLAGCPVYKVTGIEWTAARGKLALIHNVLDGKLDLNEIIEPISDCLTCNGCVDHCPSGVQTDTLIIKARTQFNQKHGQSLLQKILFQKLLLNPNLLNKFGRTLGFLQATGLRSLARTTGLTRLLGNIRNVEQIVPSVSFNPKSRTFHTPILKHPSHRVAYFIGCAGINLSPQIAQSAIRVLNKHNVEVIVPNFVCCGMPAYGYGDISSTLMMAKKNIDLADRLKVDQIITTCATCGSILKRYPELLSEDKIYSAKTSRFAGKIKDISEFLIDIGLSPNMRTLQYKATFHDPCHLGRFQKISDQPRTLLQSIPGIDFVEMNESNMCCGAAGSYNMKHHDLSMKVLDRKMNNVVGTNANLLVTCCPGCSMQLTYGISRHGLKMKSMDLIELLDLSFRSEID